MPPPPRYYESHDAKGENDQQAGDEKIAQRTEEGTEDEQHQIEEQIVGAQGVFEDIHCLFRWQRLGGAQLMAQDAPLPLPNHFARAGRL
jgi:hypothetical protein